VVEHVRDILSPSEFRLFEEMLAGRCVTRPDNSDSKALTRRVLVAGMRVKFRKAKLPFEIWGHRRDRTTGKGGSYTLAIVPMNTVR
jgi:hypothetical protein